MIKSSYYFSGPGFASGTDSDLREASGAKSHIKLTAFRLLKGLLQSSFVLFRIGE